MKRKEAISVLKELLDNCTGLDGHYFELVPPYVPSPVDGGYQIVINAALDKKTKDCITPILTKHQLAYQTGSMWKMSKNKTEPDTFIIYRPTQKT
ncbi:MAG: hypothetical protein NWF06_03130 [Candidatus Bathyarchaeota archaeon]|nr:hypothetical protein [Candidatus Bathyarchaeum sp.]